MEKIGKRIRIIVYLFSLFFIENVILQPAVSLKPLNNLKNVIIYNFRDGSPPMVVGLGDNWKTSRDKAGKTIFFRENWKDPVSNKLYHWIDKDHNPWHAYESKSNRPPVSIQIFTLSKTKPVWLGKDKFKSRNSKLFKEMDSLVDDEIPEEYQWISQENEPITPPPPPPPEASWPIPQIPLSNLIVNGISCCIENEISLFTTDVDMSPCANAPKYEFFVDRFTWMFLDPWDDEPGAGDISSFAGEKHIGLQAKYSFTVPSSSEETLEMDEYRSEILIQLDFSYMLKEDNNDEESTLVAKSYSPTRRICRVYVKDKIPPSNAIMSIPEKQIAGESFKGEISCVITDNNPNIENVLNDLYVDLTFIPQAHVFLEGSIEFKEYQAKGFGVGTSDVNYYSEIICNTDYNLSLNLKPNFKGFVTTEITTSQGFGGIFEKTSEKQIQVFDYTRPEVEVIMEDKRRGLVETIGSIPPGNATDSDLLEFFMPGTWVENTRYVLTIKVKDNIETYTVSSDPSNVKEIPKRNIHYVGYCISGDLMPALSEFIDVTKRVIDKGEADFLEAIFRPPDIYYFWVIVEDNASRIKPESYADNKRILKIKIDVKDTRMHTENLK